MVISFQVLLSIVVVVLSIFLSLFLYQLSITMIAFRKLADSLRNDCHSIITDMKYLKNRIDKLLDLATNNFLITSDIARIISKIIELTKVLCINDRLTWLSVLYINLKFVKRLFNKNKKS